MFDGDRLADNGERVEAGGNEVVGEGGKGDNEERGELR